MIKFFKNKIFIAAITIVLCLAISGVTMAVATPQSNDPVTLTVDYDTVITEDFSGVGTNIWANYLSDENPHGATETHFDLNAKRIATVPASVVRYMFMPHYIMFEEDEDHGEAKYNAGEINYNNDNFEAYVAQCRAYKEAGVRVMFNWGGAVTNEVYQWWGIKNVPDAFKGTRSAPNDLEQFAKMFAQTLKYLVIDLELTNVDTVNYQNEIAMNNFATFGDKRILWVNFLEMAHNELKAIEIPEEKRDIYNGATNLRDYVTIMGVDVSHGYFGFEGDWGANGDKGTMLASSFFKYVYENAKTTRSYTDGDNDEHYVDVNGSTSTEWYFDYLSSHLYAAYGTYCETIDGCEVAGTGYSQPGLAKMCSDMNKWAKFWVTEWAGANRDAGYPDSMGYVKTNAVTNAYEHSVTGQALTHINSGMGATLMWGYWGGYLVSPLSVGQSVKFDYEGAAGESFIVQWNAACEAGNTAAYEANKSTKYKGLSADYAAKVGVNAVVPLYGEYGLLMRYVPKTNQILGTTASVLKTESSDKTNMRISAVTQTDKDGREDITFVVESNDGGSGDRAFEINVSDKYKDKTFRKFVYEYNATKYTDGVEGCSKYDANMVLNTPKAEGNLASGGKITDSVDASKHYVIYYTTLDEAQQVYFEKASDVEVTLEKGASHTYSAIKFEGLADNTNVKYSVHTVSDFVGVSSDEYAANQAKYESGCEYASITADGVLTVDANAPSNTWITVKVAATGDGVKTGEAYAISAVYIK